MAVVRMEAGKVCFPFEVEALANFGVRRIIVVGVPFLGHFLEKWVVDGLCDQKIHRILEAGDRECDFIVLALGQFKRSEANGFNRFQNVPSLTNHDTLHNHPL
ncbi:MAG: hypothetical protein HWN66_19005 [Candidatus Helarchaeota archaeon]|nr:hypothetical protein [Candidatus Helarchaeota archaeon]